MIEQRHLQDKKRTLKWLCFEETRYSGEESRAFKVEMFERMHIVLEYMALNEREGELF